MLDAMSDLRILLAHDPADEAWAQAAQAALAQELGARISIAEDRPTVELRDSFRRLPSHGELGPLSMVLVATPDRAFTAEEAAALQRFLDVSPAGDLQLLPIAPAAGRAVPPAPLAARVAAHLEDPSDPQQIQRLAIHLLNLMGLRVAGEHRRVFLSYRVLDGKAIAEHVDSGLRARGYDVWRDELADRDGVPMIRPGSEAQQTIARGIASHGFVLVIDTPSAHQSNWVQEEVALAVGNLLPMLPIVVEDVVGQQPLRGGRFPALVALQREVRVPAAALTPARLAATLDDAFFDQLDGEMNTVLLEHLRARRRLLREAERGFRALDFAWTEIDPARLLFRADLDRDSDATPGVTLRLLVQCSPYETVLDDAVDNLQAALPRHPRYCQLAVLVHQAPVYGKQRRHLLRGRDGNLVLLRSDELDVLSTMLTLTKVAP